MFIKFSSPTCQPCKQLSKMLAELSVQYTEMQVTQDSPLVQSFGIRSVPVLIKVDANLNEVARLTGLPSAEKLKEFCS